MKLYVPASARIALERLIVRSLIRHMATKGFAVSNVYASGDHHFTATEDQAVEAVFAVDEASLRFVLASLTDRR